MLFIELTEEKLQEAINKAVTAALLSHKELPSEDLITRKEAASYLKVTLPTINDWEKKGYLKAKRIGSRVYFKKSELSQQTQ